MSNGGLHRLRASGSVVSCSVSVLLLYQLDSLFSNVIWRKYSGLFDSLRLLESSSPAG